MKNSLKRKLYFIEERPPGPYQSSFEITHGTDVEGQEAIFQQLLQSAGTTHTGLRFPILTDPFEYKGKDQVIPLQPEQVFFMDYTDPLDIQDARILEVGLGSGVLSIFSLLKGAAHCTGLEINPRAKIFTGFNTLLNDLDDRLHIISGNTTSIFAPVNGQKFDFILSNPPFEPTPPGMDYYFNSAAGIYGLSFVTALLEEVDNYLDDNGVFQMVTMAPGDVVQPFLLHDLVKESLPGGAVEIILDLQPITYDDFVQRFVDIFEEENDKIEQMKAQAQADGVTHLHMLVLKYKKGQPPAISTRAAHKVYETWSSPLGVANELYQ